MRPSQGAPWTGNADVLRWNTSIRIIAVRSPLLLWTATAKNASTSPRKRPWTPRRLLKAISLSVQVRFSTSKRKVRFRASLVYKVCFKRGECSIMRGRGAGVSGISGGMNTSTAGTRNAIGTSTTTTRPPSSARATQRSWHRSAGLTGGWSKDYTKQCSKICLVFP